jgi:hypothetical protein
MLLSSIITRNVAKIMQIYELKDTKLTRRLVGKIWELGIARMKTLLKCQSYNDLGINIRKSGLWLNVGLKRTKLFNFRRFKS